MERKELGIEKELPGVKKNILLKNYTTFKIGGSAKYFFGAKNKEDLIKAIKAARKYKLPFFILGGGSNLLVSDKGFNGLVIKIQNSKFKILNSKIIVEAGMTLEEILNASARAGLTGFEWAAGIPGTVGGAIFGNAGAFGKSMANLIKNVEALEVGPELRIKNYELRDCKFTYKDNIFKKKRNLIILSSKIQLKKSNKKTIQRKIKEYLNYRKKAHPLNFPSAGSIFKNYESRIMNYELLKEFPELEEFNKKRQIPAGYLIEKIGLKGKKIGKVKISEKHANFIVNLGQGKAKDVRKLIKLIKQKVKNKFGIFLEEEIQYLS